MKQQTKYDPIRIYKCEYTLLSENGREYAHHFRVKAYTKKQARIAVYHEIENRIRIQYNAFIRNYSKGDTPFIEKYPKIKNIKIIWEKDLTKIQ